MLTTEQRRARQRGADPDTWTGTGPQRRRIAAKEHRADPTEEGHARRQHRVTLAARAAAHRAWVRGTGR